MGRRKGATRKAGSAAELENTEPEQPSAVASPVKSASQGNSSQPKYNLNEEQKSQKRKEMLAQLEKEAATRSAKMETLVSMLCQSLVIRCEAILDRVPHDIRSMPVRDFVSKKDGNNKLETVLRPLPEAAEVRRSIMAVRRGTVTLQDMEEESEEAYIRKRKRELGIRDGEASPKRQRRQSDEDDLTSSSSSRRSTRSSVAFHAMLPQTPAGGHRPMRKPRKDERLFSINGSPLRAGPGREPKRSVAKAMVMQDDTELDPLVDEPSSKSSSSQGGQQQQRSSFIPPGGPDFAFDPSSILSVQLNNFIPQNAAQKKEVDKRVKDLQEQFEKLQKAISAGQANKGGQGAKKVVTTGGVNLKGVKPKVDAGRNAHR